MKKVIFIAVLAVASLASCKKDRTCTCTDTSTQPGYVSTTNVTTYTEAKKADARAACSSYSMIPTGSTYTYTTTCKLN